MGVLADEKLNLFSLTKKKKKARKCLLDARYVKQFNGLACFLFVFFLSCFFFCLVFFLFLLLFF